MSKEGDYTNFTEWLSVAFQRYTREGIKRIGMICWSIWNNRNEIVWNQKGMEFTEVVELAFLGLQQCQTAQDRSFDNFLGFMTQVEGMEQWKCPNNGIIKVNIVAVIFEDSDSYSYSRLARNHLGELVDAFANDRQGRIDPTIAEVMSIKEALSWINRKAWPQVIVETDCLVVIQAIWCSSVNLSYLVRVVDECKKLLVEFRDCNVTLNTVKRSANIVAHFLARYNCSIADSS